MPAITRIADADRGGLRIAVHPTDRRSRLVALTPVGEHLRSEIQQASYQPPKELLDLSEGDLKALRDALKKLPGNATGRG